jgi:hypothetical protein
VANLRIHRCIWLPRWFAPVGLEASLSADAADFESASLHLVANDASKFCDGR